MPVTDLTELLRSMDAVAHDGVYAYCTIPDGADIAPHLTPMATIREAEGLTLIVPESQAAMAGLDILFRATWISLTVHSDLAAVGLTAAIATALADAGISCNVVAGAYHDHLFVPAGKTRQALDVLERLQQSSSRDAS